MLPPDKHYWKHLLFQQLKQLAVTALWLMIFKGARDVHAHQVSITSERVAWNGVNM
jgi:hypothetical protein